jgi:lipoate-protein ligase A
MKSGLACRLIIDPPATGDWNMAVDEALLIAATEKQTATLRLYEWAEPTLSLGYFQRHGDRDQHEASRECPVVRRQSGGGAILHDQELTYSLTLPSEHPLAQRSQQLYGEIHEAIIRVLERPDPGRKTAGRLALHSRMAFSSRAAHPPTDCEPFLCFERRSPGDVVWLSSAPLDGTFSPARNWKIVGSAQRRHRGAVLQHGSVLLSQSSAAPELMGYNDLVGTNMTASTLSSAFSTEVSQILAAPMVAERLPESIRGIAQQISRDKYESGDWTKRR